MSDDERSDDERSDDEKAFTIINMDGPLLLINMLMCALRRQAVISLGGECDEYGRKPKDSESPDIEATEIKALMVKLVAQGFKDSLHAGFLGNGAAKEFASDCAEELARMQQATAIRKRRGA